MPVCVRSWVEWPVRELITHHFPLDEFATAPAVFNERREGSIMVIIEP